MKSLSSATTRSAGSPPRRRATRHWLAPDQVVESPETFLSYRVVRFLGEGGFGQVYLARPVQETSAVAGEIGLKVSTRMDGWLREAYFGQLLDGHPRAIRLFDAFPLPSPQGQILYCLALEYARHGDLRAFLA